MADLTRNRPTNQTENHNPPRLLRPAEVRRLTTLSTTEIYRRLAEDRFPKQIRLGARSVVWLESDIHAWIEAVAAGEEV